MLVGSPEFPKIRKDMPLPVILVQVYHVFFAHCSMAVVSASTLAFCSGDSAPMKGSQRAP